MIVKKLQAIQSELDVPKSQFNAFGKYYYRNAEDILAAAKPICIKHDCLLTVTDEIVMLGDRFYVKATACIAHDGEKEEVTAYAREELTKKGMDASQITGSASSYARKYALNGLFCLDDVKDADHNGKNGSDKATYEDANKVFSGINESQRNALKDMAETLGLTPDQMKKRIKDGYGVTNSKALSSEQADELLKKLEQEVDKIA